MKTSTVKAHARTLRRICESADYASMVPDHLPGDPVRVGRREGWDAVARLSPNYRERPK